MFDIGFSELMVIAVIALVVIGPERLPRVARTLGHLAGRLQRYVADVKADINREVELDELRKMRDSMKEAASSFEGSVRSGLASAESEINSVTASAQEALKDPQDSKPASEEAAKPAQEGAPLAKPDPQDSTPPHEEGKAASEAKPAPAVAERK
jgi:sec-independent protein translocase protein TatB